MVLIIKCVFILKMVCFLGFFDIIYTVWHKDITKNRKLYIYQTIIQSILMYGAEVWQIPTREINKILSTEIDVLRRSARKSRMEKIKNEHIKEIMGVKEKPDIVDVIERKRLQWYGHIKRMQEERLTYLLHGAESFLRS
jgi:hypothetical protein